MTTPPTVGKMSEIAPYLDTIASGMAIGSRLIADLREDLDTIASGMAIGSRLIADLREDLDTIASGMAIGSRLIAILRDDPSVVHAFDSVIRDLFNRCRIELVPGLTAASATKDRQFGHQHPAVINNGGNTVDDTGSDDTESDDETARGASSD